MRISSQAGAERRTGHDRRRHSDPYYRGPERRNGSDRRAANRTRAIQRQPLTARRRKLFVRLNPGAAETKTRCSRNGWSTWRQSRTGRSTCFGDDPGSVRGRDPGRTAHFRIRVGGARAGRAAAAWPLCKSARLRRQQWRSQRHRGQPARAPLSADAPGSGRVRYSSFRLTVCYRTKPVSASV